MLAHIGDNAERRLLGRPSCRAQKPSNGLRPMDTWRPSVPAGAAGAALRIAGGPPRKGTGRRGSFPPTLLTLTLLPRRHAPRQTLGETMAERTRHIDAARSPQVTADTRPSRGMRALRGRLTERRGATNRQPIEVLAHMLLAALIEAALLIARGEDPAAAMRSSRAAVDRLIDGILA
jgi:hypothetical protein